MTRLRRERVRTALVVGGLLPLLLALGLTVLVGRTTVLQHAADSAYADGRNPDAERDYRSAGRLLPFEDWIAAFDAGVARHTDGDYPGAVRDYLAALAAGVPLRDQCTVRINLGLADEAIGDKATSAHQLDAAAKAYQAGIAALEAADCPTHAGRGAQQTKDGKAVDDRLHAKLQHNAQQQDQQKKSGKKKPQQPDQGSQQDQQDQQQKRADKLEQQNQQGLKERQRQQEQDEGFGYQPAW